MSRPHTLTPQVCAVFDQRVIQERNCTGYEAGAFRMQRRADTLGEGLVGWVGENRSVEMGSWRPVAELRRTGQKLGQQQV